MRGSATPMPITSSPRARRMPVTPWVCRPIGRASVALKQTALPLRVARTIRSLSPQVATQASASPLRRAIEMRPARRTFAYSESAVFLMKPLRVAMTR